jgi:hypothetical protein
MRRGFRMSAVDFMRLHPLRRTMLINQTMLNERIKQMKKDKNDDNGWEVLSSEVQDLVNNEELTLLQAVIINFLTDPQKDYSAREISDQCIEILGQGSRRHVRKIRSSKAELIKRIYESRYQNQGTPIVTKGHRYFDDPRENFFSGGNGGGDGRRETTVNESDDGFWDVTEELPKCVQACSKVPNEVFLYLSATVRTKIRLYMKWAKAQEWLAYLVGEKLGESLYEIHDLVLPDQNANSTLVSKVNLEDYNKMKIVGVMHSHHEMGGAGNADHAGFSGHDEAFINSNHDISLLVAKDGIAGHVRVKTECGSFFRAKAVIKESNDKNVNVDNLKEEFKSKINFGSGRGGNHRSFSIDGDGTIDVAQENGGSYHFS